MSRVLTVMLVLASAAAAAMPAWKFVAGGTKLGREPGQVVPDFALPDVRTNQLHRLSDHQAQVVVIVFCGTHWPMAQTYLPRLSAYAADGEMRRIDFVAINSNAGEQIEETVEQARALRVRFPVLKDPENRVADLLAAECLGEVLVIDRHGRLRYRGAIDDQLNLEPAQSQPTRHFLLDAIDAVLAGKAVSPGMTPVAGPRIERISSNSNR
jgi:peroxiredoxin